jgi:hypothetical protein
VLDKSGNYKTVEGGGFQNAEIEGETKNEQPSDGDEVVAGQPATTSGLSKSLHSLCSGSAAWTVKLVTPAFTTIAREITIIGKILIGIAGPLLLLPAIFV